MNKYRNRIYSYYVDAWDQSLVPSEIQALSGRAPTMRYLIRHFFPQDKTAAILDLGCGHGTLIYFAHKEGYLNTYGVDVSTQQVNLADKLGIPNVHQGDLMDTLRNINPNSLDAIVTFDVIEHFTKDELIELIDAIRLVLKKGGRWIIHAPNANSPFFGSIRYGDYTHEQAFTPSSLQQLLKASKFCDISATESAPSVYGLKSLVRVLFWKFFRLLFLLAQAAETGDASSDSVLTRNFYTVAIK